MRRRTQPIGLRSNTRTGPARAPRAGGQSLAEYALVIAMLVTAMLTIQTYVKRTLQARYRDAVDGAMTAIGAPTQYEPYYRHEVSAATDDSQTTTTYRPGGQITTTEHSNLVGAADSLTQIGTDLQADREWQ